MPCGAEADLMLTKRLIWASVLLATSFPAFAAADQLGGGKAVGRVTLTSPEPEDNPVDSHHSAGLFVGVGKFDEDSGLSRLNCAPDDAVALAYAFVLDLRLIPPQQAFLALGGEPKYRRARRQLAELEAAKVIRLSANKAELLRALRKATDQAGDPNGMLVLSFSSHGYEEKGQAYLMPSDGSRRNLEEMGIAMQTLKKELREAKARKKLLIVDACREAASGQTRGEERMPEALEQAFKVAEGFGMLVSCSAGQLSWEDPGLEQGVFTHFIIEGLRPGVIQVGEDGFIRLGDLSQYAAMETKNWVRKNRQTDQVPFFEGDEPSRKIPLRSSQNATNVTHNPSAPGASPQGAPPHTPVGGKQKAYIFPLSFSPEIEKNYPEWTRQLKARGLGAQVYEELKNRMAALPQFEPYSVDEDSELYKKILSKLQPQDGSADFADLVILISSNFFFDRTKQKLSGFMITKETEYHAAIYLTCIDVAPNGKLRETPGHGEAYNIDPIVASREASAQALGVLVKRLQQK